MSEAMEKWDTNMLSQLLPRIMQIITEIDRRYCAYLNGQVSNDVIERTRIIKKWTGPNGAFSNYWLTLN